MHGWSKGARVGFLSGGQPSFCQAYLQIFSGSWSRSLCSSAITRGPQSNLVNKLMTVSILAPRKESPGPPPCSQTSEYLVSRLVCRRKPVYYSRKQPPSKGDRLRTRYWQAMPPPLHSWESSDASDQISPTCWNGPETAAHVPRPRCGYGTVF